MSLSISHAVLIEGAARLAGNVTNHLGRTLGFAEILHGSAADDARGQAAVPEKASQLREKLTAAIRSRLAGAGIATNPPVRLSVTRQGGLRVEGHHPRAAEIESLLNADPALVETAQQLRLQGGQSEFRIDLTPTPMRENMSGPGGYPNW